MTLPQTLLLSALAITLYVLTCSLLGLWLKGRNP